MNISLALRKIPCLQRLLERMMFKLREVVAAAIAGVDGWTPAVLLKLESKLHHDVSRECVDPVMAHLIQAAHTAEEVRMAVELLVERRPHARLQKRDETVHVRLLGGSVCALSTPYYLRRPPGGLARRGRWEQGNGFYHFL